MSTLVPGRMSNVSVILTRWFLIIAIAYAIIFSNPAPVPLWPQQVVIAVILGSNLVLAWVLARGKSWRTVSSWMTGLDIAAVSMAISVAGNVGAEFYLIYFCILILAAVVDRRDVLIFLTLSSCSAYAALLWIEAGGDVWRSPELLVRLPVLFGVSLYFGTAVQQTKHEHERQAQKLNIEREKALSALTEMGNIALSGGYPGPVLYELAGWVQEIVEFDRCSLLVFSEGGERGYLAASGDDPSIEVLALEMGDYPELGPVLERGEYTEIHPGQPADLWQEMQAHLPEASPFTTFIIVPIKRTGSVIGAFYLRDSDPVRTLSEAQTAFCFQAAQMASAFIHEHDLLATLEKRSQQDSLTGLLNYETFIEHAEELIVNAVDGPVSMAMINIDKLSEINKLHGHKVGTKLISYVGRRLVESLSDAAVCRYGGDEFIALTSGPIADFEADLQGRFLDHLSDADDEVTTELRASVGIASAPADGDSAEALFAVASARLRAAKGSGGHQINTSAPA